MKLTSNTTPYDPDIVNLRCPACRRNGSFPGLPSSNDIAFQRSERLPNGTRAVPIRVGIRVCPNVECRQLVFVVSEDRKTVEVYPAERLDFDPANIPQKIIESFEEALTDHANRCFKSAAIMVRRTLEEICADRGATGKDLKARLTALRNTIIVPQALLDAADELRILGNDAAHLEAKVYDDVGREEVEIAIELCKELLKATYQFDDLLERLRKLKKAT